MKNLTLLFLFLFTSINLFAQGNNPNHHLIKKENSYLFVDNTPNRWYSLEIETDTLFFRERFYITDDAVPFQIGSNELTNIGEKGVVNSIEDEEKVLLGQKKWELDYLENSMNLSLENGSEMYHDSYGKPFLIWWFKVNTPGSEKETKNSVNRFSHQLYLNFIVNGRVCASIVPSVYEGKSLDDAINKAKKIADSLKAYGGPVDLEILKERSQNTTSPYVLKDNSNLLEIKLPDWAKVIKSPMPNAVFISFPEKANVINAVSILWDYKSNTTFDNFKNRFPADKQADENSLKLIVQEEGKEAYFYTEKNARFHIYHAFLEGENGFCFVRFTATSSTYEFNLKRLNELFDNIKLK